MAFDLQYEAVYCVGVWDRGSIRKMGYQRTCITGVEVANGIETSHLCTTCLISVQKPYERLTSPGLGRGTHIRVDTLNLPNLSTNANRSERTRPMMSQQGMYCGPVDYQLYGCDTGDRAHVDNCQRPSLWMQVYGCRRQS